MTASARHECGRYCLTGRNHGRGRGSAGYARFNFRSTFSIRPRRIVALVNIGALEPQWARFAGELDW